MRKAVLVTRHRLLPSQEADVNRYFTVVAKYEQLPSNPREVMALASELKSKGVDYVITTVLPPQLLQALERGGLTVVVMKMDAIATVPKEEAEKLVAEKPDRRVALPGRSPEEPYRVVEYKGLYKVRVVVEEEPLRVEQ